MILSIYENNVWKAKQGNNVSSDIIKDSDLNKDYIDKEDGKYIVKTSKDINNKQNKITLIHNSSDRNNADFNVETDELRIWDPSFDGGKNTSDYMIIDSTVVEIESTDDSFGTIKYLDKFYLQKKYLPKISNKWEVVNASDFIKNSKEYTVLSFDNKYYYRINCSIETQFRLYGFTIFVNPKFISENISTTYYIGTSIEGYSSIFEWDKNTNYGKATIEKEELAQYLNGIYIERKRIS